MSAINRLNPPGHKTGCFQSENKQITAKSMALRCNLEHYRVYSVLLDDFFTQILNALLSAISELNWPYQVKAGLLLNLIFLEADYF